MIVFSVNTETEIVLSVYMVWKLISSDKMEFWLTKCEGRLFCLTKQCIWFHLLDNSCLIRFDHMLFVRERGGEINYHVTRLFTETLIGEKCSSDMNWDDNYVVNMINSWGSTQICSIDSNQQ